MGFRLVFKLLHLGDKKFWSIFCIRWDPNQKKNVFFSNGNLYTLISMR
jgi:hypothetical protein